MAMSFAWPSVVLAASSVLYPASLHILSKFCSGPASAKNCRDGISVVHCSIITISSISALIQKDFVSLPVGARSRKDQFAITSPGKEFGNAEESINPMLIAKSTFANSITALETGYLVQDSLLLLHDGWKGQHTNLGVLVLHHVTLATALSWLQTRIWMGKEKGVYIVVMFMVMNASTPLQNLRSFLLRKYPGQLRAVTAVQAIYLTAFFWCRVYLPYYIVYRYGASSGRTASETFTGLLRVPCQIGTASLALVNSIWWFKMVNSSISRYFLTRVARRHI